MSKKNEFIDSNTKKREHKKPSPQQDPTQPTKSIWGIKPSYMYILTNDKRFLRNEPFRDATLVIQSPDTINNHPKHIR